MTLIADLNCGAGAKNAEQARQNAGAVGWRLTPAQVTIPDPLTEHVITLLVFDA